MKKINRTKKTADLNEVLDNVNDIGVIDVADEIDETFSANDVIDFPSKKPSFKKPGIKKPEAKKRRLSVEVPKGMKIDFENLIKPSDVLDCCLEILEVGKIDTAFGEKTVIHVSYETENGGTDDAFMYATDTMADVYDKFLDGKIKTVTPVRKESKTSNNSYITYEEKFDGEESERNDITNLKDLDGKTVYITSYKLIDTKYGEKFICNAETEDEETVTFLAPNTWKRFFKAAERSYSAEDIKNYGLEVTITSHISEKTGNTYYMYN